MVKSMNKDHMRDLNLKLMLQFLFNSNTTSRIEIANNLSLNKSTISSLYNTLFEQGYIQELGQGTSSEAGGRKPTLIKFNHQYGFTINYELGHHHLRIMLNWLNGEQISFESISVVDKSIEEIIIIIKDNIRQSQVSGAINGLLGISIAINGIVYQNKILDSPFIDMHQIDLVAELAEFQVPIILENEANLSAIATHDYETDFKTKNIIALDVHNGIGAGIIINHQLYRGLQGEAGEIGRSLQYPIGEQLNFVPIEQLFSEDAVINSFKSKKNLSFMDRNLFLTYYQNEDTLAIELMHRFTQAIAFIIFNISQSFAPDFIYLQSRIIGEIPTLLDQVLMVYHTLSGGKAPHLKLSPMIESAPLYGGAAILTHQILALEGFDLYLRH
ncbi:ROK family protein [Latilactobacillus sakei]|uniref:ROK family protein n=1 Tax=Latilactobacillus sakei TaxID=1599 RepID=UPI000DC6440B|nr:ROK family protein [Latilactobacillus sakei]SPS04038.1 N-acetylglucosamine repressor [Latilactobacillus sakei]